MDQEDIRRCSVCKTIEYAGGLIPREVYEARGIDTNGASDTILSRDCMWRQYKLLKMNPRKEALDHLSYDTCTNNE